MVTPFGTCVDFCYIQLGEKVIIVLGCTLRRKYLLKLFCDGPLKGR